MMERQSVEVDYCPQCRGIWLDRGELDKIIERTLPTAQAPQGYHGAQSHVDDDHWEHGRDRRKRGGLLGELFDFG